MFTTDNPAPAVRSLLAEVGLRVDPQYRGEVARLFDGRPGIRRRYLRRSGLTIDQFTEVLADRGVTQGRIDCTTMLEYLETILTPDSADGTRKARRRRDNRAVVSELEAAAVKAKRNRLRKSVCPECSAIGYSSAIVTLEHCGVTMQRVDLTFPEVMRQTAAMDAVPF